VYATNSILNGNKTGVSLLGSRFNHSCAPNVNMFRKTLNDQRVCFRTTQDISPGTELTVSYMNLFLDGSTLREDRREKLRQLGFECQCTCCMLTGEGLTCSETLRKDIEIGLASWLPSKNSGTSVMQDLAQLGMSKEQQETFLHDTADMLYLELGCHRVVWTSELFFQAATQFNDKELMMQAFKDRFVCDGRNSSWVNKKREHMMKDGGLKILLDDVDKLLQALAVTSFTHLPEACYLCSKSLDETGRGRQWFSCGHAMHELCAMQLQQHNDSDLCPRCQEEYGATGVMLAPPRSSGPDSVVHIAAAAYNLAERYQQEGSRKNDLCALRMADILKERAHRHVLKERQLDGTLGDAKGIQQETSHLHGQRAASHDFTTHEQPSHDLDKCNQPLGGPMVLLIEFSRHPDALRKVLLEASELEPCRALLQSNSMQVELKSGAKIFVRPERYEAARLSLQHHKLYPKHVILDLELEPVILKLVQSLPGHNKVPLKTKSTVPVGFAEACVKDNLDLIIKRTFIHIKLPSSLYSVTEPSAHSTTDAAKGRKGKNPRAIRCDRNFDDKQALIHPFSVWWRRL